VFIRKDLTKFYHFQCRIYLFKTLIHVATGVYTQLEVSFLRLFCLRFIDVKVTYFLFWGMCH